MFKISEIKQKFILSLFSISIFFSYFEIYTFQARFTYLIVIFFFIYDFFKYKNYKLRFILISLLIISILFFYSYYKINSIYEVINYPYDDWSKPLINSLKIKLILQCFVIFCSVLIINQYKNLIYNNIFFIINFYVFIFIFFLIIYVVQKPTILFDTSTIFNCSHGFFYVTKYIFKENSHFSLLSPVIIIYFLHQFHLFLNNKFLLILNILFLIFCFLNFSATFYLSLTFSLIAIFLFCRKLDKSFYLLSIFIFILSTIILFSGGLVKAKTSFLISGGSNCVSTEKEVISKYNLSIEDKFKGSITSGKTKIIDHGLKALLYGGNINLTSSVYIFSLYFAFDNLLDNPLGVGLNNYLIEFKKNTSKYTSDKYNPYIDNNLVLPKINLSKAVLSFNFSDGSINTSKLIVEFGFLALIFLLISIYKLFYCKLDNSIKIFLISIILPQLIVRGSGYFYSGFLICFLLFIFIVLIKRNEK